MMKQKIRNKRVLKNGATAGYVYYPKDKKWKWRIVEGPTKKGGAREDLVIKCLDQIEDPSIFFNFTSKPLEPRGKILENIEDGRYVYRVVGYEDFMRFEESYDEKQMPLYVSRWTDINNTKNGNIWNKIRPSSCGVLGPFSASWATSSKTIKGYVATYKEIYGTVFMLKLDLKELLRRNKKFKILQIDIGSPLLSCAKGIACLGYLHNNNDFIINDLGKQNIFDEIIMTEKFLKSKYNNDLPMEIIELA